MFSLYTTLELRLVYVAWVHTSVFNEMAYIIWVYTAIQILMMYGILGVH